MKNDMREAILIQCLDDLEMGMSVADIVTRYPEYAAEIRPILFMATELTHLSHEPLPAAQTASRERFLAQAEVMRQVRPYPQQPLVWWRRLMVVLALFALLFVGTITTFAASAAALPGDALYPVKRTRENLQLALTRNESAANALREQFQDERAMEIKTLLELGREREVTCEGVITVIDVQIWRVCGLDVVVDTSTTIMGQARVGSRVQVRGLTRSNTFVATTIIVFDSGATPLRPTATSTATPTVTATAVSTRTPSPTLEPTLPPPDTTIPRDGEDIEENEVTPQPVGEDDDSHATPPADEGGDDDRDGGNTGDGSGDANNGNGNDSGDDSSDNGGGDTGDDNNPGDTGDDDGSGEDGSNHDGGGEDNDHHEEDHHDDGEAEENS